MTDDLVAVGILALALAAIALFATFCALGEQNAGQPQKGGIESEPSYKAAASSYEQALGEHEAALGDDAELSSPGCAKRQAEDLALR